MARRIDAGCIAGKADAVVAPARRPRVCVGLVEQAGLVLDDAHAPERSQSIGRLARLALLRRPARQHSVAGFEFRLRPREAAIVEREPGALGQVPLQAAMLGLHGDPAQDEQRDDAPKPPPPIASHTCLAPEIVARLPSESSRADQRDAVSAPAQSGLHGLDRHRGLPCAILRRHYRQPTQVFQAAIASAATLGAPGQIWRRRAWRRFAGSIPRGTCLGPPAHCATRG